MAMARVKKAAREEANWATRYVKPITWKHDGTSRFDLHIMVHPMPVGPVPDQQNIIAALKAHFDGIADALGVNDKLFNAPTLEFIERTRNGKIYVRVTQC